GLLPRWVGGAAGLAPPRAAARHRPRLTGKNRGFLQRSECFLADPGTVAARFVTGRTRICRCAQSPAGFVAPTAPAALDCPAQSGQEEAATPVTRFEEEG